MTLPFGLHWKCPHHPDGCQHRGPFSDEAIKCKLDQKSWSLFRKVAETMKPMMKKPTEEKTPGAAVSKWVDADFEKEWPYLSAFLADTVWDDGTQRETGTLLIFVQEGYLKVCLNDRAANRSAFVTGPTINMLFDACEAGLEGDSLDWRKKK